MNMLGICINLANLAPSQWMGFNFNSICEFNGILIGSGDDGIYEIEGETQNGSVIESYFALTNSDFGTYKQKKVRSVVLSGYCKGILVINVLTDGDLNGSVEQYTVTNLDYATARIDLNSNVNGRFIGLKVGNKNGADFSIDAIDILVIPTAISSHSDEFKGRGKAEAPMAEGDGSGS